MPHPKSTRTTHPPKSSNNICLPNQLQTKTNSSIIIPNHPRPRPLHRHFPHPHEPPPLIQHLKRRLDEAIPAVQKLPQPLQDILDDAVREVVRDDAAGRDGGREGHDADEAARPGRVALVGLVVGLEGQVAELVGGGDLGAEGLLGAEDGAGQVGLLDGGLVEGEVEGRGGVGDAVADHGVRGGGGGGGGQGEKGEKLEKTAWFSGRAFLERCTKGYALL